MRIGELSERTGIATRMLRYYESQGLIESLRESNGYRAYGECAVDRAMWVRGLIRAGLTTRMAKMILDAEQQWARDETPECPIDLAKELADELTVVNDRLQELTRSRDTLSDCLARTRHGALRRGTASP
ncbi:MerR family DNA-binding transcriptional regulator [Promicromonospora thailandica]|uniref:DNA-binding transcriptional regulator, MerR family n=1 Tax=Promicromonospora thailandica TaxID=765201 RepID=A0A9X2FWN5_9MICO|nr:MerR family transcriptional regulator [Promicromonospora thailandica]MCP2262705.1 DNA-binding transcriptional regulator, MerR family [Promicromonospora thailandica]